MKHRLCPRFESPRSTTDSAVPRIITADTGVRSFNSQNVISTAADGARSVFASDVDGSGDLDVLSASAVDNTIAWYEKKYASASRTQSSYLAPILSLRLVQRRGGGHLSDLGENQTPVLAGISTHTDKKRHRQSLTVPSGGGGNRTRVP